ncbi:cell wall hydrolase [Novosphingobium pentaromativorans]|uniref:Cell wall hydrolase, SleB n=1 Tax=Novosphingobium pentaromativorans US6-1 TaxID=1088721 RepID=G6E990_9SPHN|nr:cell wall hydrolase [Novosphingobium pentaromativorans US6-1]EHJ62314.1 cell wall hydrolase, SleB [Novosphingobium pentaromativorans US6-1]
MAHIDGAHFDKASERNRVTEPPALMALIGESEARPRDFAARFERGRRNRHAHRAHLQRRWSVAAAGLAAIALPAFASPGHWDRFTIAAATAEAQTPEPMPFERAGSSFPGSAFYYLEQEAAPLQVGEGIHSDAGDADAPAPEARAPARPLTIDASGIDRTRALQCMTAAIYYEAASEAEAGQRAVAQVVLNRVAHPAYPNTVCGVVYEGSERSTGCQFSFTCDGSLARKPSRYFWDRAMQVARAALTGYVYAPVGLATHYHTVQVHPYWAASLEYLGTIGAHRFYSFHGAAGRPGAFRFAYLGGEPAAAPHPRDTASPTMAAADTLDPVAIQRKFDAQGAAPTAAASPIETAAAKTAPAPIYSSAIRERGGEALYRAQKLPETGDIKPQYANSGRWIAQPGT